MTQFVNPQSQPFGSVPEIPNEFATADLNTTILWDPQKIRAYKESVAKQMNAQSGSGVTFEDLTDRIADVTIETAAQGASILTVSVIDRMWGLLISGFIQTDEQGFLWPPIDINFPTGTDMVWRLAQVAADWDADLDSTQGNLTLTFEDRIASLLRQMSAAQPGGLSQGQPNQTLGGFIKQLVDNTNSVLHLKQGERIRLVQMISPQDPNYTPPINDLPSSAQAPLGQQPVRKDPLKLQQGLSPEQQAELDAIQQGAAQAIGISPGGLEGPAGGPLTLAGIEAGAKQFFDSSVDPFNGLLPPGVP